MSAETHVAFLLACIKYAQPGGKIDFDGVATELNIKTKAAAAKRYERLKKKAMSGASLAAMAGEGTNPATPPRKTVESASNTAGSSKRKRNSDNDGEQDTDVDTETAGKGKGKGKGKGQSAESHRPKRRHAQKAASAIKLEAGADDSEEMGDADDDDEYDNVKQEAMDVEV